MGPSPREASSTQIPEAYVGLSLLSSCAQQRPVLTVHAVAPQVQPHA